MDARCRANLLARCGTGAGFAWTDWSFGGPFWPQAIFRAALQRRVGASTLASGMQCARASAGQEGSPATMEAEGPR
eukprot:11183232-Lingulodinium_polyedra.AAC.1